VVFEVETWEGDFAMKRNFTLEMLPCVCAFFVAKEALQ